MTLSLSEFAAYFELGFDHILDPQGYDHVLFVVVLCAVYAVKDWKRVAFLVTAFTLGHCLTLALSTLDVITVNVRFVELMIVISIILTGISNLFYKLHKEYNIAYLVVLFFGLIHGLGFSNYLKMILGNEENIGLPLLYFNIGVEAAQLVIVAITLGLSFVAINVLGIKQRNWNHILSMIAIVVAVVLLIQRI